MRITNEKRGWIGFILHALRAQNGWSLNDAAEKLQIEAATLGSYERGGREIRVRRAIEVLAGYGYTLAVVPLGCDVSRPWGDDDLGMEEIRQEFAELRELIRKL